MKVLLINGSPHEKGCTYTALDEIRNQLTRRGIDSEILWLGKEPIMSCQGCGACAKMGKSRCVYNDVVNTAIEKMETCDGIIVGSPVHYAGASGQVTSFLGRMFYSGSKFLRGKPASAIVSCRRGELRRLTRRSASSLRCRICRSSRRSTGTRCTATPRTKCGRTGKDSRP